MELRYSLSQFIDETKRVETAYLRAERSVLIRAAARGRTFARNAMRRRSRASRPGEAPSVRRGQLKRFLIFAFDAPRHVALFGPRKLAGATGDTPEALERGKTTIRRVGRNRESRSVRYLKRPAMVPALGLVSPELPGMWSGAIKG